MCVCDTVEDRADIKVMSHRAEWHCAAVRAYQHTHTATREGMLRACVV